MKECDNVKQYESCITFLYTTNYSAMHSDNIRR